MEVSTSTEKIDHVRYALTNPYFPKIESRTSLFVVFVSCVYIYCDFACLIYTLLVGDRLLGALGYGKVFKSLILQVALYVGGLYICGKIGWESVMKMGQDTRELFFNETFLYYNPLLLITMMVWLCGVNLWVFSRTGVSNILSRTRSS
ncbi:unnamed protein product [Brassica oleracea var. botrytis]